MGYSIVNHERLRSKWKNYLKTKNSPLKCPSFVNFVKILSKAWAQYKALHPRKYSAKKSSAKKSTPSKKTTSAKKSTPKKARQVKSRVWEFRVNTTDGVEIDEDTFRIIQGHLRSETLGRLRLDEIELDEEELVVAENDTRYYLVAPVAVSKPSSFKFEMQIGGNDTMIKVSNFTRSELDESE
jgi:hypothetical protein